MAFAVPQAAPALNADPDRERRNGLALVRAGKWNCTGLSTLDKYEKLFP